MRGGFVLHRVNLNGDCSRNAMTASSASLMTPCSRESGTNIMSPGSCVHRYSCRGQIASKSFVDFVMANQDTIDISELIFGQLGGTDALGRRMNQCLRPAVTTLMASPVATQMHERPCSHCINRAIFEGLDAACGALLTVVMPGVARRSGSHSHPHYLVCSGRCSLVLWMPDLHRFQVNVC